MPSLESSDPNLDRSKIASDSKALTRGVLVNAAGYTVKIGMPVLLAFGTRTYGAAAWGVFITLQALLLISVRVTLLGLDKAMLWWIPSRGRDGYPALSAAIALVAAASIVTAALLAAFGEPILQRWNGAHPDQLVSLRIMALGLPLFAATELLLNASMGRRRMEPIVVVRETLAPASLIAFALALHACGIAATGLAWAFVLSNLLTLLSAIGFHSRIFAGEIATSRPLRVPRQLFGYALPMWLAEIANTLLLRLNALMVAAFTDPVTVGVWSIVTQFGTALRTIRGAFDPIVTVLAADIARERDSGRLSSALSYAAQLVSLTQFPLFAFLLMFADLILPLYGPAFARGSVPLVVLCAFWLANGAAGLAGVVIAGHGKSHLTLLNTIVTIALQALSLWLLVPRFGLIGASVAVGASYAIQHLLQLLQMRRLTGSFHFSRRASQPLVPAAGGAAAAALAYFVLGARALDPWLARSATFAAFLAAYAAITYRDYGRGRLRAPA